MIVWGTLIYLVESFHVMYLSIQSVCHKAVTFLLVHASTVSDDVLLQYCAKVECNYG